MLPHGRNHQLTIHYCFSVHQLRFIRKLHKKVLAVQQGAVVWFGDFNITPDPHIDTKSIPKWGKPALNPLISNLHLYDVWRCQHAGDRDYTFLSSCHNSCSRIDLFLLDQCTLQNISSSSILPANWSDSPICITIVDNPKTTPACLWRMNTHILKSKPFSNSLHNNV